MGLVSTSRPNSGEGGSGEEGRSSKRRLIRVRVLDTKKGQPVSERDVGRRGTQGVQGTEKMQPVSHVQRQAEGPSPGHWLPDALQPCIHHHAHTTC